MGAHDHTAVRWLVEEAREAEAALARADHPQVVDAFLDSLGLAVAALVATGFDPGDIGPWHQLTQASRGREPLFDLRLLEALLRSADRGLCIGALEKKGVRYKDMDNKTSSKTTPAMAIPGRQQRLATPELHPNVTYRTPLVTLITDAGIEAPLSEPWVVYGSRAGTKYVKASTTTEALGLVTLTAEDAFYLVTPPAQTGELPVLLAIARVYDAPFSVDTWDSMGGWINTVGALTRPGRPCTAMHNPPTPGWDPPPDGVGVIPRRTDHLPGKALVDRTFWVQLITDCALGELGVDVMTQLKVLHGERVDPELSKLGTMLHTMARHYPERHVYCYAYEALNAFVRRQSTAANPYQFI